MSTFKKQIIQMTSEMLPLLQTCAELHCHLGWVALNVVLCCLCCNPAPHPVESLISAP